MEKYILTFALKDYLKLRKRYDGNHMNFNNELAKIIGKYKFVIDGDGSADDRSFFLECSGHGEVPEALVNDLRGIGAQLELNGNEEPPEAPVNYHKGIGARPEPMGLPHEKPQETCSKPVDGKPKATKDEFYIDKALLRSIMEDMED